MSRVHAGVISYIRAQFVNRPGELADKIASMDDDHILRMMFSNYRGSGDNNRHGLRLTKWGLMIMQLFFKGYDIAMPEKAKLKDTHLLYLDSKATMPYYCGSGTLVVYDHVLGIKLKLADGLISTLIEIED